MSNSPDPDPTDPILQTTAAALNRLAGDMPRLGIALSGGGDSVALMHLARRWAGTRVLMAATVDHGLRAGSAAEARQAGQAAQALGIPHQTLGWQRPPGTGNLMAAARDARLSLLSDWARRNQLSAVLLGHTLDDQAETLLMRLARGAGVDGLSGMAAARDACGVVWLRPLLDVSRAALRDWLRSQGIDWIDDPSNQNDDYERVRIRKALAALDLPAAQLSQSAANLGMARDALQDFAAMTARNAQASDGVLRLPIDDFRRAPTEIQRRLLVAGLRWVCGSSFPARRESVLHALDLLAQGKRVTLNGAITEPRGDALNFLREPAAAQPALLAKGCQLQWDGRWQISGLAPGQQVGPVGYAPLPALDWRQSGLGRDAAAATPGIWMGPDLVAAPVLKAVQGVTATPLRGLEDFRALLYTH